MEVIWTKQAIKMVSEFVDYIARDDYSAAEQWALERMSKTDKLAEHPRMGRIVSEYNEKTLLKLIVGNYPLPYRIKEDGIYIKAVWHVRQIPAESE